MKVPFTKMHGCGNDYVYLDCITNSVPERLPEIARWVSDRNFGVGADGLILIHPSDMADARMQMFNADGSEAEMCGNGLRCVARYVYDQNHARKNEQQIETANGIRETRLTIKDNQVSQIRVAMGNPILDAEKIPTQLGNEKVIEQPIVVDGQALDVTCVSMGNPHCVIFVDDITDHHVLELGPLIENHADFPARTNVEFVKVLSPVEVEQRTWERGSGETLACGTGACAVCVAGVLTGRTERKITNHLRGGDLILEWDEPSGVVYMSGTAEKVFDGAFDWN